VAPPEPPSPTRPATTLRVAVVVDPISIDPRHVMDAEGEAIVRALFDGLVDLEPGGRIVGAAATHWDVEDDGRTYRFHLAERRFHDGERVTAQHHADALLGVFDPGRAPTRRDDLLNALRGARMRSTDAGDRSDATQRGRPDDVLEAGGIEVVGTDELVIRLVEADPLLLQQLADPVLVPLPRVATVDPEGFALAPVGNGPFRMVGPRDPGAFIRLAADRDHPRPPQIDGLVFQVYAGDHDGARRWADLMAGRLQVSAIPAGLRNDARDRFGQPLADGLGSGLHEGLMAAVYAYGFVLDVAPYDDVRLRRAIAASIDRDALADDLATAGVTAATALLPAALGGALPDCAHCRYDPELAQASFADWVADQPTDAPPGIALSYPRGAGHATVAERIAADLESVLAVSVRLQSLDLEGLVRGVMSGEAPLFRYGLQADVGGPAAPMSMLDPAFRPGAPENWIRWEGAGTTALLDRLRATNDVALAREMEAALLESAAVIPLLWTRHDLAVAPEVVGFRLDVTGRWWPEHVRLR